MRHSSIDQDERIMIACLAGAAIVILCYQWRALLDGFLELIGHRG